MGSSHSSLVNLAYLYHSYVSVTWVRARAFLVCSLCIPRDQGSAWWREKPSDYLGNERTACGVSGPFKDEKVGRQQGLHSGKASEPLLPVGWLRKALGLGGDGKGKEHQHPALPAKLLVPPDPLLGTYCVPGTPHSSPPTASAFPG